MAVDAARAKSLFLIASDISDPAARNAFLERECSGDVELRARVEALLRANDAAPLPPVAVEEGIGTIDSQSPATGEPVHSSVALGTVISGKYKLVEVIGEGGMGCVYLAKQTEPVQRTVAVKLIRPGMDSRAVLARFEAERQALAVMDHPNIAKILDGGLHDNRPFFVMELVKGTPITTFCDERKLTPKERLELFVPVCQAIQHAHQKGIIHRDIKPSNVLIALYDDNPVPKVIDFGVAKATGPALTEESVYTAFGAIVGTPEYMSPEQASLNNLDIDTRSDVYALGVLLYELLTGTTPVDRKQLKEAAILEVLRIVREVEAPRPSTKLSSSEALPSIAADRNTEPAKLSRLLKGELDWILLKALEKDRSRRYDSANGFAADLQRYLAGEPVQAVPPSTGYRLKKFVRRHKGAVIAVGLVLTAMLVGMVGIGFGMSEGEKARLLAREKAQTEIARKEAEAARDLLAGEKEQTDKARKAAEDARDALKLTQENLARIEYGRTIQVAYQAWRDNDVATAMKLLHSTRKDLRGWEWHFVHRLCHTHKLSFMGEGASWSRDRSKVLTRVENTVKIWDARIGKEILALKEPVAGGEPWIPMASLNPEGTRAFTIGQDGKAKVWDASSGAKLLTLEAHPGNISCGSWSPEGSRIVTGSDVQGTATKEAWAKVWDARSGAELLALKGHVVRVAEASFSPDGSRIATTGLRKNATGGDGARLWDARTGKVIVTRPGGRFAAFSPDSSRVIFTGTRHLSPVDNRYRQEVQVLNAQTGAEVCALKGQPIFFASFSPDSSKLVSCSDVANTATVWDAKTGTELLTLRGHQGAVMSASFSPDGARIITGSFDRTARVWDAKTGVELRVIKGHTGQVWSASFAPDGKHAVTHGVERNSSQTPKAWSVTKVWEVDGTAEVLTFPGPRPREFGSFPNVSFSPDSSRVAIAGGRNRTAKVWDATSGAALFPPVPKAPGPKKDWTQEVWSVCWSPDGSLLICDEQQARVWDVKTGEKLLTLGGKNGVFHCAAWSPDGSQIVTGEWKTFLPIHAHIWDAKTGAKLLGLGKKAWVKSVAFSPDSARVAIGTDTNTAHIFDARTGVELLVLKGHSGTITAVSFSTDGTRIVTGSEDQTAKVWDARSGAEIRTLKGHTDEVQSASFSPDGSRILTGSFDRTVKIWDAKSGAELLSILGHTDHVICASWSPDGWRIATGSRDQTAKIWDARQLTKAK